MQSGKMERRWMQREKRKRMRKNLQPLQENLNQQPQQEKIFLHPLQVMKNVGENLQPLQERLLQSLKVIHLQPLQI